MSNAASSERPEPDSIAPSTTTPWRTNALLFVATVASVITTGIFTQGPAAGAPPWRESLAAALHPAGAISRGSQFAGALLLILVAHELGHYVAARIHKVDASLPFFIPLPLLSPFGTMGAVIRMRGVIPTRRALLDIGASGPLAGLCFAIPLYVWGSAHSHLVALPESGGDMMQLGESVLMKVIDHFVAPAKPEGMDLELSPIAFGAWGGMFVTMINLLPVGQLDGGHVAYALFGPKQDRYAQLIHRSMLVFFFVVVFGHVSRDLRNGLGLFYLGRHLANSLFWLVWFNVLAILGTLSRPRDKEADPKSAGALTVRTRLVSLAGLVVVASIARDNRSPLLPLAFFVGLGLLIAMEIRGGTLRRHDLLDHPATAPEPLDLVRAAIAVVTLLIFGLLFMPEPFSM